MAKEKLTQSGTRRETEKQRAAFHTWYELDRRFDETLTNVGLKRQTLANWIKGLDWHKRADALDAKTHAKMDAKLITEKAKRQAQMVEMHFKLGSTLAGNGLSYLNNKGLESGAQAITAIKTGIDIQRKAEGLPDWLIEIGEMTEDELIAERNRILSRLAAGNNPATGD